MTRSLSHALSLSLLVCAIHAEQLHAQAARDVTPPVQKNLIDNPAVPIFDWRQIQRRGGDEGRLPANTVFVNQSLTSWEQYRGYYIGVALFVLLQSGMIAALLLSRRRRTLAEATLREAEERWKFALEGAGAGVWDWNIQTGDLLFTKRSLELFGYGEAKLESRIEEWMTRVHPEDMPRVKEDVRAYLEGRTPTYVSECRVLCKDGSWKWARARGMVVSRDDQGKPLRMIGTQSDISERRAAEENNVRQLKELRQWYEATLGREDRLRQLKAEVNELRRRLGEAPRYRSEADALGAPAES